MRTDQLQHKLNLVQQLKTLARQHEQILQAYERKVQEKLQESSLAATAGGKRAGPPLVAEGPEAKRHRQLQERANRKQELWNEVTKIVEKIRKNNKSEAFRAPVDVVKFKIPDYYNVIKKPMDLGTVLKKLRSKPCGYSAPAEVAEDVRQIWINCRTYNGELHPVTGNANACSEVFEKSWGQANIEQRWNVELAREMREEQAFAGGEGEAGDDTMVNQLRSKRNVLGDYIAAKDVQDNLPPGSLGDLAPDRDMTFEEKRKLSAHMASLPGEKLVAVLDIIQEGETIEADGDGEVEVDIDALHNNTLWKLKAYVDGVLTATSGPPPKKSANRTAAPNKQGPPPAAAAAAAAGGGGMPPPPPPGQLAGPPQKQQPLPAQQQPGQQPPQLPAAPGAMPPPPQQPPQFQPPAPMQPPAAQQQQQQPGQQQQQGSPVHSAGGVSAQEVVGSTAGGPGAARSHQFTYDQGTVAQSGTNARPSNFVKANPNRQQTPTGEAAAAGAAAAAGGDQAGKAGATLDADQARSWEAELLGGSAGQGAAAPAGGAAAAPGEAAAAAATPPGDAAPAPAAPAAAAEGQQGPAADAAAPDAAAATPAGDAPAPAPAAGAAEVKREPAAEAPAAAPADAAAAAPPASPAAAAEGAPAAGGDPPAAAAAGSGEPAAGGDGATAAAEGGDADDDGIWGSFQSQAKQQEEELAKQKEAEQRRAAEAEEQRRLKEQQEQRKAQEEKEARAAEILGGMGPAGAAANDDAVHADVEKLLKQAPPAGGSPAPGAAAAGDAGAAAGGDPMDVDGEGGKQQQDDDDSDDGPADGGGFD